MTHIQDAERETEIMSDTTNPFAVAEERGRELGGDLQLVPSAYYEGNGWGSCTVYADDDGEETEHG